MASVSILKQPAERHGAALHFTNQKEGGAMIRLVFPLDLTPIDPNLRN